MIRSHLFTLKLKPPHTIPSRGMSTTGCTLQIHRVRFNRHPPPPPPPASSSSSSSSSSTSPPSSSTTSSSSSSHSSSSSSNHNNDENHNTSTWSPKAETEETRVPGPFRKGYNSTKNVIRIGGSSGSGSGWGHRTGVTGTGWGSRGTVWSNNGGGTGWGGGGTGGGGTGWGGGGKGRRPSISSPRTGLLCLEKVPQTDRWRFMNVSKEYEEEFAKTLRQSLKSELAPHTLPLTHPISLHVRRVITRILDASELGKVVDEERYGLGRVWDWGWFGGEEGWFWGNNSGGEDNNKSGDGGILGGLFETETLGGTKKSTRESVGGVKDKKWEVVVVNDPNVVNAMAAPGEFYLLYFILFLFIFNTTWIGLIVVFTGILPICQDEEGLAAVLAHEIGHVVARHTAERLSSQTLYFTLLLILHSLGLNLGLSDVIQKVMWELPGSRKQELEADVIGLRLMSRACYDPGAAPRMFSRLANLESKHASKLEFFQTHPSSENRVKVRIWRIYLLSISPSSVAPSPSPSLPHFPSLSHSSSLSPPLSPFPLPFLPSLPPSLSLSTSFRFTSPPSVPFLSPIHFPLIQPTNPPTPHTQFLATHLPSAYAIFNSNPNCAGLHAEFERFREGRGVGRVWVGRGGEVERGE
ncbi:hypothetical protein CVT24_003295 [Panaeolus cyanescens]|uniref:Peptidase M48 domain-containing protein n=1 Tax=Panaeolus cyanescens TaxID=181874 RepID=A0A409YRC5_9AGAR|nr:hypothetical protein CVT24_003295 [Panaeolus cyanescens]